MTPTTYKPRLTLSEREAKASGFLPLTHGYALPEEAETFEGAIDQLRGAEYCLVRATIIVQGRRVEARNVIEIWRKQPSKK